MDKNKQAIFFIILSAVFFSLMSFFVRLSGDLPTYQKAFFRNAVAVVVAIYVIWKSGKGFHIGKGNFLTMAGRVGFGTSGMLCNFYAIDHMNLSDANMLNKLAPFFAIISSAIILKEMPKRKDVIALLFAFGGALLIMKPSFDMHFAMAVIGALGGLGAGVAYTCVRKLGNNGVEGPVIVLCFSMFSCIVTLLPSMLYGVHMSMQQVMILMGAGICGACAQFSITAAYTRAPARNISIFEYTQIIFAALWGLLFLHQLPDALSFIGYIVIISSAALKQRGAK